MVLYSVFTGFQPPGTSFPENHFLHAGNKKQNEVDGMQYALNQDIMIVPMSQAGSEHAVALQRVRILRAAGGEGTPETTKKPGMRGTHSGLSGKNRRITSFWPGQSRHGLFPCNAPGRPCGGDAFRSYSAAVPFRLLGIKLFKKFTSLSVKYSAGCEKIK